MQTNIESKLRLDSDHRVLRWGLHLIVLGVLAIITALIYRNSLDIPFVFDDAHNIFLNPFIRLTDLSWSQLYDAAFEIEDWSKMECETGRHFSADSKYY